MPSNFCLLELKVKARSLMLSGVRSSFERVFFYENGAVKFLSTENVTIKFLSTEPSLKTMYIGLRPFKGQQKLGVAK